MVFTYNIYILNYIILNKGIFNNKMHYFLGCYSNGDPKMNLTESSGGMTLTYCR